MVFKGRFFSSSRKSSPDGSNSPKTPTQEKGSPSTRSDKKKVKSDPSPASTPSPSSSSSFSSTKHRYKEKHKDKDIKEPEAPKDPTNPYLSPILASSLGLNRIKTRSGPLLQEGLRGDHRMSGLGTGSNLSRGQTDITSLNTSTSSSGKKDVKVADKKLGLDAQLPLPEKSGKLSTSRNHADEIKSPAPFTPESESTSDPYDTPKESESPRFKAIMQATSAPRKKGPGDIKSFSHELNSKGVRPYPNFWKPRGVYNLKEVLKAIQVKFEKAKEEVDSDLAIFAGELLGIMEKSTETHPEWKETLEDLLILARSCSMMTPGEFWLQCEGIVQDLDDHRQDLPMGVLKKLYTRMLFILTRCTRLLQFHKENNFAEDEVVLDLKGPKVVQSIDRQAALRPKPRKSIDNATNSRKSYSQEQRLKWKQSHELQPVTDLLPPTEPPSSSREKMTSWKPLPSPVVKKEPPSSQKRTIAVGTSTGASTPEIPSSVESSIHLSVIPSDKNQQKVSWGYWPDQPSVSEESSIMCRICEEYVPTQYVEDHSKVCAIADKCDQKGLSVDERLIRIAEMLEKLIETYSQKDMNPSVHVESDGGPSPKLSDWSRRGSTDMLDCFQDGDINPLCFDDLKGLPSMTCKTRFGQKSDQGMATSSAGSMTPRSPLTTPRSNHFDMLLTGRNALAEADDIPQIIELADIARCIATSLYEEKSSPYLVSCMEDLQEVIGRRKHDALTVQTFGVRIEKLHQEKYLQLCDSVDEKVDSQSTVMDEEDDVVRSLRASPVHPIKDRTSIDDFEIIKPISRGAFGRVFLAKKRTTGDLFAIKVLKKADMIRKNAVESILAERDILITVRNPFVVRFFYSFTSRENLYLVMEYLNGGDLYSLLRNLGCLDEDVARIYIAEVVLALEYLHSNRIVHRDLKPDNLLLNHDGHIKLTDFGLSKVGLINSTDDLSGPAVSGTSLYGEDDREHEHEHENDPDFSGFEQDQIERRKKRSAVGTPDYLAPEILLGTGHGASADWWSVGVILFELIVGIPPFNAEHPQMIFDNILNRKIPWPRVPEEMSTEAADLIDKLLTEDPHQRLGAKGASEVKQHIFFKNINWDTLARQKAAFVPSSDGAFDTSYFTSRYSWNPSDENILEGYELEVSSDDGSVSGSSSCVSNRQDDMGDECGGLAAELYSGTSVNYSFSNFSFKNLSQLASINYDLLGKGLKEDSQT